jgi:TRAP-type mannitol/chloroaromatic compound transport system permease small subunit
MLATTRERGKTVSSLLHSIDNISNWIGKVVSFLIIALTFLICIEVVARYLLNRPTIWAQETSGMLMGAYIIFGGAYTLYTGGHVNMDVVYGHLTQKKKALIDVITFWLFLLFCGGLLWMGGDSAWRALRNLEHSGSLWNPPIYPFKLILPIGVFLLLLQGLAKFVRDTITLVTGGHDEH